MPGEGLSIPYDIGQEMKKMATGGSIFSEEIHAGPDLIPWLAGNSDISLAEAILAQNEMMSILDGNENFEASFQEASKVEEDEHIEDEEQDESFIGHVMDTGSNICTIAQQQQEEIAIVEYCNNASNVVLPDMALNDGSFEGTASTTTLDAAEFATLQQEFMLPGMMEEDWDIWLASLATQQSSLPSESTGVMTMPTTTTMTTTMTAAAAAAAPVADEILPTPTSTSFSTTSGVSWPCSGSPTSTINTMEPMTPVTPSKRLKMSTLSQLQQYSDHRDERHTQLHLPQDVLIVIKQENDKKLEETHFPEFISDKHLHTLDEVSCFECGWSSITASLSSRKHNRKSRISSVQEQTMSQEKQTRDKERELLRHPALRNKAGSKHLCSQCIETKEEYQLMNATEASKAFRLKRSGGSQALQQLPHVRKGSCKMYWIHHLHLLYNYLATVREIKDKEKADRIKTKLLQEELPSLDDLLERGPVPRKEIYKTTKIREQKGDESREAADISKRFTLSSRGILAPMELVKDNIVNDKLNELADAALCGLEHTEISHSTQREAHNDMGRSSDEIHKDRNEIYKDDDDNIITTATLAQTPYLSFLRSVGLDGLSRSCVDFAQPHAQNKVNLAGMASATVPAQAIESTQEGDAMAVIEESGDDDEEITTSEDEDEEDEREGESEEEEEDDEEVVAILSPADDTAQAKEYEAQRRNERDQLSQEVRIEYLFRAVRRLRPDQASRLLEALRNDGHIDHDSMMSWMTEMTNEKRRGAIQVFVAGQWKQLVQECGYNIAPGDYEGMAKYLIFGHKDVEASE